MKVHMDIVTFWSAKEHSSTHKAVMERTQLDENYEV